MIYHQGYENWFFIDTDILDSKQQILWLYKTIKTRIGNHSYDFIHVHDRSEQTISPIKLSAQANLVIIKIPESRSQRKKSEAAIEYCQHNKYDLIALFRHKPESKLKDFFIGSFAQAFLKNYQNHTLLLNPDFLYSSIPAKLLFAFDYQNLLNSEEATLIEGIKYVQFFKFSCHTLIAMEPWFKRPTLKKDIEQKNQILQKIERLQATIAKIDSLHQIQITSRLQPFAIQITDHAAKNKFDLIAIYSKNYRQSHWLKPSIAKQIIAETHLSVLLFKTIKN